MNSAVEISERDRNSRLRVTSISMLWPDLDKGLQSQRDQLQPLGKHVKWLSCLLCLQQRENGVDRACSAVSTVSDVQLAPLWPIRVPGAHPVGGRDAWYIGHIIQMEFTTHLRSYHRYLWSPICAWSNLLLPLDFGLESGAGGGERCARAIVFVLLWNVFKLLNTLA